MRFLTVLTLNSLLVLACSGESSDSSGNTASSATSGASTQGTGGATQGGGGMSGLGNVAGGTTSLGNGGGTTNAQVAAGASGGTQGINGSQQTQGASGGATTTMGGGGASGGAMTNMQAAGGGTAADAAPGTGGMVGSETGGTGTGGASGGAGAETGGAETGGAETGGAGTGGAGGAGESGPCGGHAVSLSANGTGSMSDAAYANVEIDMQSDLPIGNTARTIEFWAFIRTTDWVGDANEVYYYGGSDNAAAFGLDFGTDAVSGQPDNHATLDPITGGGFNDDSTNDLGIDSSTDQWVHVAMVWDGSVLVTYVNGLPKITTHGSGVSALNTGASPLVMGCNPTNQACFGGYFDELRVWNVARSAADIQASYDKPSAGDEAGLVGYWKFDEDSGTTAADAVSAAGHTAHEGTLKAASAAQLPTFVEPSVPLPLVCP